MQPVWSGHYQGTFNSASSCLKRSNFNFSCGSNSFPGREGQCVCPLADGKAPSMDGQEALPLENMGNGHSRILTLAWKMV